MTSLKEDAEQKEENSEENRQKYGTDFELEYAFASQSESFAGSLILDNDSNDDDDDNMSHHHIIISPPKDCISFARSICYVIDRSIRSQYIWMDIVRAMEYALNTLTAMDRFSVILFDDSCMEWGYSGNSKLHRATQNNIKSAVTWLNVYKPTGGTLGGQLEESFCRGLDILKQESSDLGYACLVVVASSLYENEHKMAESLPDVDCPRIYGMSLGNGANRYFLKYLASVSRGKSIHLDDPHSVYSEMIAFFNEFQSPICMDLSMNVVFTDESIEFDADSMMHPYPIGDVYAGCPLLIKLDVPKGDIAQITLNGYVNDKNSKKQIKILVINDGDDMMNAFPMEFALAQSHLDCLHANAWNTNMNSSNLFIIKANAISDLTGLPSPTRLLKCVEEITKSKESQLSSLALPPRTGRGARRKKAKKNKAAAVGVTVTLGTVSIVVVASPFGGDDEVMGGIGESMDVFGSKVCDCCTECAPKCCCECCDNVLESICLLM